jgi:hypothetical protein
MTIERLIDEITEALGVEPKMAERGLWATVHAVGPSVQPEDRRALPTSVPPRIRDAIAASRYVGPLDEEAFYESVAQRVPTTVGHAREIAQVVLKLISARLGPERRGRLAHHAGPSMAWLWEQPPRPDAPPSRSRAAPAPGHGHTLASGRPGSLHPLADAGPLGQTDSVVRSENPKADRKLSSAQGTTAEQTHRTLAEGQPGSDHAISEERD